MVEAMLVAGMLKNGRPALAALVALGLTARLAGFDAWSLLVWAPVTAPVLLALIAEIVAALSMTGALALGETLAATIVAPMDAGGVRRGDVVPVDGTAAEGIAVLDQSALTGESLPVQFKPDGAASRAAWRL